MEQGSQMTMTAVPPASSAASIALPSMSRARRRADFHASDVRGVKVSPELASWLRDGLFAVSTIAAAADLRLPGHLPLFTLFVLAIVASSFKSLLAFRVSARAFVPPLMIFMCIHLGSAFRLSVVNGLTFILQATTVSLFIWAFVVRYSQVSMAQYLKFMGPCLAGLLIWVIGYHLAHHHLSSWKLLGGAKIVFDLLPITLLVIKKTNTKISRAIFPFLLPIFTVLILLSGERKAYILIALLAPLLINFRNPVVYISILMVAVAIPAVGVVEKSGYVSRQLKTLSGFASGKIEKTNSNTERSSAVKYALVLFKKNPMWGVGTNNYIRLAQQFEQGANETHNDWLRVAAENGLIGLFFYTLTVLYGFVGLFRRRTWGRLRNNTEMIIASGLYLTLLMYLSLEAYQFLVLLALCTLPFIQYLRLDPNNAPVNRAQAANPRIVR